MRRFLPLFVFALFAVLSSQAKAQVYQPGHGFMRLTTPTYAAQPGYYQPSHGTMSLNYSGAYPMPYSYHGPSPLPARIYVGYGSNDFAFFGQPYGGAHSGYSWGAMSQVPAYPMPGYGGFRR